MQDYEMNESVAIIGMSGKFPDAGDIKEFWNNLENAHESIRELSVEELQKSGEKAERFNHPDYVKAAALLDDIDRFDADFFNVTPKEAELMDPQHRLFLESAWEALETAGYSSDHNAAKTGVFAGTNASAYLFHNLKMNPDFVEQAGGMQSLLHGFDKDHLTTRVSYKLNLNGPSFTVQSACSSSLVSVALACQSLLQYQCDMALAGGVSVDVPQKAGYMYQEGSIFSPDGRCRVFDKKAGGTVFGSGVGAIVLKRLEDAVEDGDSIDAVIRGSAVNNDGSDKVGYTAPGVKGQAEVISEALEMSEINPGTIGCIEAHGTGTQMGDPIEVEALTEVFRTYTEKKNFCAIGSVKSNVGHLNAAAGIAGLIKTVLSVKYKKLPPTLHFKEPNPQADLSNSPFYVNTTLQDWEADDTPRRAGVSSFGMGGTNAHVILEEAPVLTQDHSDERDSYLLLLSARSEKALENTAENLARHLKTDDVSELKNIAYTLQVGRKTFDYKQMIICKNREDALKQLEAVSQKTMYTSNKAGPPSFVTFMFPGQGSQYIKMGNNLYKNEPVFRKEIDRCRDLIRPFLDEDVIDILYHLENGEDLLKQTKITQPALFIVEYALATFYMSLGVRPNAMIGHSIGEYTAACLAGVMSLEDALQLVAERGRLTQTLAPGDMLAVPLSEEKVHSFLNTNLSLAAVNTPSMCVVSGTEKEIKQLKDRLAEEGVNSRNIHTSHAFHSYMLDPVLDTFRETVTKIKLNEPAIPYISNVTGTWIRASEAADPEYWVRHLRHTVQFSKGIREIMEMDADHVLVEAGPGNVLSTLISQHAEKPGDLTTIRALPGVWEKDTSDDSMMLTSLGKLWLKGIDIEWEPYYKGKKMKRVQLPAYPFEKKTYWVGGGEADSSKNRGEEQAESTQTGSALHSNYNRPNLQNEWVEPRNELEASLAEIWRDVLGIKDIGVYDSFFDLGGHSLLATQLLSRVKEMYPVDISMDRLFEDPSIANLSFIIEEDLIEQMDELTDEEANNIFQ